MGNLNITVSEDLKQRVSEAAKKRDVSIAYWVRSVLEGKLVSDSRVAGRKPKVD
jgi:predicted HicB family RNase H-like nuclease